MEARHSLYLAGYVNPSGNIDDPIFIRLLDNLPNASDVPKNCFAVTESFDGRYWSSTSEDIYPDYREEWRKGDFCVVAYFSRNTTGNVDHFYCELTQDVSNGKQEYVSGKLYTNEFKLLGHPKDICVSDISDIY